MNGLARLLAQLKDRGERITIQRRMVLEVLCDGQPHLTINTICHLLRKHHPAGDWSEATVYRILTWLKGLGLVSQTDIGEAGIVYDLVQQELHHHLICLKCGGTHTISDMYFAALREQLLRDFNFSARVDHMAIYGICPACKG